MYSIIDELNKESNWLEFLEYKFNQNSISKFEFRKLSEYITNKRYKNITDAIIKGKYSFSIPVKKLVNKINKDKKRVVYSFNEDETMVLKMITYLFTKKYDYKYSCNCYSFRRKYTIKHAINKLVNYKNISSLYGYKIDISNYFNSINVDILLSNLKDFINDEKLYILIRDILTDNRVIFNDKIIYEENKGIMAGIPISSFLANIYLLEVDKFFRDNNVLYLRYSDDIILFSDKTKISKCIDWLNKFILDYKLSINPDKIMYINPGDKWEFLGFSYYNGMIDVSSISKKKIKNKIKRSSKKIRRWMISKNVSYDKAMKVMIRKYNNKFFNISAKDGLTWSLWYFPIINTADSLKEIDRYLQQNIRYICTGKYNKKNYNIKYDSMKKLGYISLVNEYYKFKSMED